MANIIGILSAFVLVFYGVTLGFWLADADRAVDRALRIRDITDRAAQAIQRIMTH